MSGMILGCIEVTSANNQIDFTEDPLGVPASFTTQLPTGDYFPDSDEQQEDLAYFIECAMNDVGAFTYSVSFLSDGTFQISTSDGAFQILTSALYSDSIFLECGYPVTDPTSTAVLGVDYMTATESPSGTFYPKTPDDEENLLSDTRWDVVRTGKGLEGSTGVTFTRKFGQVRQRAVAFAPVVGVVSYSDSNYDTNRMLDCFENHWCYGYRVRVFPYTQTATTPLDGEDVFDAYVVDEEIEPRRFQGFDETDMWEITINFSEYQEAAMAYSKKTHYNLNIKNNSVTPASKMDIATGHCRSSDNTADIDVTSTLTVDMAVAGANGLDTGAEAIDTWYYFFVIKNLSTNTVAGLASVSATAPTMPSGYTKKKRVGEVRNDGGSDFLNIEMTGGGPYKRIRYKEGYEGTDIDILDTGVQAAYTDVDMSTVVPPTAVETECHIYVLGPGNMYVREDGEAVDRMMINSDYQDGIIIQMGSGPAQTWEYKTTGEANIEVLSYTELL
jgi:hypothetical protein